MINLRPVVRAMNSFGDTEWLAGWKEVRGRISGRRWLRVLDNGDVIAGSLSIPRTERGIFLAALLSLEIEDPTATGHDERVKLDELVRRWTERAAAGSGIVTRQRRDEIREMVGVIE